MLHNLPDKLDIERHLPKSDLRNQNYSVLNFQTCLSVPEIGRLSDVMSQIQGLLSTRMGDVAFLDACKSKFIYKQE